MHFQEAHSFTAQWEGGLVNHPADPGGTTNHGVSLRWLRQLGMDVDGDGDIDADDIKALTKDQAKALFKKEFWDKLGCGSMPRPIALVLYDGAVNQGAPRAAVQLQRALNRILGKSDMWYSLAEDGVIGPKTREAIEDLADMGRAADVARAALDQRNTFYTNLAKSRPEMACFLKGWLNRIKALASIL